MNTIDKNLTVFSTETASLDAGTTEPFAKSRKIYVEGSRPDIRVPFREISLSDTSGPYTDPTITIDIRNGLPAMRAKWIMERGDVEELDGPSSEFGKQRKTEPELAVA